MIVVHCPLKQEFIIALLQEPIESLSYRFVKKDGLRLYFEVNTEDIDRAIAFAKAKIKSTEIGNILYFQITVA